MIPQGFENINSFYYAILYAIQYQLKNKKILCQNDDERKRDIDNDKLYDALYAAKEKLWLYLDIQNFENQCFSVNDSLNKYGLFLRVYELKDKFRYLIKQDSEKKTVLRELSSCINEKFNIFNIVRIEFSKKLRQHFRPIDIIFKTVKKCDEIINCYFSVKLNAAFRRIYNEGPTIKHCSAWQCYFCSNYNDRKVKFDRHFKNCTGRSGYVYNFNTQSLLTFEEHLK